MKASVFLMMAFATSCLFFTADAHIRLNFQVGMPVRNAACPTCNGVWVWGGACGQTPHDGPKVCGRWGSNGFGKVRPGQVLKAIPEIGYEKPGIHASASYAFTYAMVCGAPDSEDVFKDVLTNVKGAPVVPAVSGMNNVGYPIQVTIPNTVAADARCTISILLGNLRYGGCWDVQITCSPGEYRTAEGCQPCIQKCPQDGMTLNYQCDGTGIRDTTTCTWPCGSACTMCKNGLVIRPAPPACNVLPKCPPGNCSAYKCHCGLSTNVAKVCAAETCTDAECCSPPTCSAFQCISGTVPVPNAATKVCKSLVCTATECCQNPACSTFTCLKGVPVANPTAKICSQTTCCQTECCTTPQCTSYTCSAGTKLANAATIKCADFTCTDAECCDPPKGTCGTFTCPAGQMEIVASCSKTCAGATCTAAECCIPKPTCGKFDGCTGTLLPDPTKAGTVCAARQCAATECCVEKGRCDGRICQSNELGIMAPDAASKVCNTPACTYYDCCITVVTCKGFSCPAGTQFKNDAANIKCGGTAATVSECCDPNPTCAVHKCTDTGVMSTKTDVCASEKCSNKECCPCIVRCTSFTCPAGTSSTDAMKSVICKGDQCVKEECCVPNGKCAQFTCEAGSEPKKPADYALLFPGATVLDIEVQTAKNDFICAKPTCTQEECCKGAHKCYKSACPPGYSLKPTPADRIPSALDGVLSTDEFVTMDATVIESLHSKSCDAFKANNFEPLHKKGDAKKQPKVFICHGTASDKNPYVLIEVDQSAVAAHFSASHANGKRPDIYPNSQGYDGANYDCKCNRIGDIPCKGSKCQPDECCQKNDQCTASFTCPKGATLKPLPPPPGSVGFELNTMSDDDWEEIAPGLLSKGKNCCLSTAQKECQKQDCCNGLQALEGEGEEIFPPTGGPIVIEEKKSGFLETPSTARTMVVGGAALLVIAVIVYYCMCRGGSGKAAAYHPASATARQGDYNKVQEPQRVVVNHFHSRTDSESRNYRKNPSVSERDQNVELAHQLNVANC